MHDVAIVGAGPGGSATAYFLARRGLDVLLLDRSEFPRDKTCGDGLTPRALRVLDAMGILQEVEGHGRAIGGYEVVAPNGKTTTARITSQPKALVVPRLVLDDLIRQRALHSGAHFRGGVTVSHIEPINDSVTLHTSSDAIRAKTAVIATGAATGVLTRSGILRHRPKAMLAARAYFEGIPEGDNFQLRFDGVPLPGYGWVFPVGNGVANVGVGFLPRKKKRTAHAVFDSWSQQLNGRQVGPLRGYPIRVDFLASPTYAARTLLVGEAAGLVNPLTGEGIDYALESGRMAAEHLTQGFDGPAYHHALHARFGNIFRFSEHIRDWYCIPPLLNVLVPLANRRPELRQLLASIVLGEREPAGFGPLHMLARLVLYLARTRPRSLESV
jgi:geranylgeranyl reductase family protein